MLLDEWLPVFDFREYHERRIAALPARVWDAIDTLDMGSSPVVRFLLRLRGMPARGLTLARLGEMGFVPLDARPGEERVLGLIGRFWTPRGELRAFAPAEFRTCEAPGFAKVAWNFRVSPSGPGFSLLSTETRIACPDAATRRRFHAYWTLIRPGSGWIRREMLRLVARAAE